MGIVSALIPTASADVVAIYPEAETIRIPGVPSVFDIPGFIPVQVFDGARPMRVQVSQPSQFMTHPVEDGSQVTDHRIILPVELTMTMILEPDQYRLTYQLIKQAYLLALRFSVQTKADTFTGMYISDIPHEEDPALFDTITMVIQLREVQFFPAQPQLLSTANVENPIDSSIIQQGEQVINNTTPEQNNRGSALFQLLGGLFDS